ncbi:MAG: acyl carrier protein [Lachnospiraceae bacterium]|nr:acyl carrier protein [Lachnospiraceae bacterium]MDD7050862.1 acyl carrier protein [Lachnospiraceae bacterium]MDY4095622.1 acyl carrier protein [Lachnospiraceae bacterium]
MTFEKVKEIIVDTLGCDEEAVVLTANLKEDLGADSLDAVELNMALEEEFGLTISDEALVNFVTVQDIVDYISGQSA